MFDPASLTQQHINDLRQAAEGAWGDDTRHESFIGHPDPCAGQCFVTSRWAQRRLGGHVGTKNGHFFWVSPDKGHVLDLTGDQFSYPPANPALEGMQLDEHDEPWSFDPHHKTWRPGPAMYKRADHPVWKGFRVLPDYPDHERGNRFAERADAHMRGRTSSYKHADLMGADPYPGSTPQKQEEWDIGAPLLHDEPDYQPSSVSNEYRFILANGQLHVSPIHDHTELAGHAGIHSEDHGPTAVGFVQVEQGHALWSVESNIGLHGLADVLKDYSETVGWDFEGMTDSKGEILHDDFGPKQSMWYRVRSDGHLVMAHSPLPRGRRLIIEGKTAYVHSEVGPAREALTEWATDFGYRIAEFPGGGNMEDKLKVRPNLDTYNRGFPDREPERTDLDLSLNGDLRCGTCGKHFPTSGDLLLHRREHEHETEDRIEDGKFPWPHDFDDPLGFGTFPIPNSGETIASVRIAYMPLPSYRDVQRFSRYAMQAGFQQFETTPFQFYGAFASGQMIGYAAVRPDGEVAVVDSVCPEASVGLLNLIKLHRGSISANANSTAVGALLRAAGLTNTSGRRFAAPDQGQEPKDVIEAAIPFVWDVGAEPPKIHIGYAGEKTQDIRPREGRFTPGGIVEGYYEPGGKVFLISTTPLPWTVRQWAQQWYHQFPQMEISSVELEKPDGKTQKLAATNVGQFMRTIIQSDQAAQSAYQALRYAGGKVSAVGGAIRDALRQQIPRDIDLMVSGLPSETVDHVLSQLPGRVDFTGKRFGVYRYRINGQEVEISLPRQDKYETSRRGEGVITVDHNLPVEKDLERRDFTANSMAVDLDSGKLIDPYGGARDIERGLIRTTHPDSFKEDPTRLVRALTMHGRFGFNPDERTRHEMEENAHRLRSESPDALNKGLDKLFTSGNPAGAIRLGQETGLLKHLYPEVDQAWDFNQNNPHHNYPLGEHLLQVLDNTSRLTTDPDVRLAALMHDVGKPHSEWQGPDGVSHYYRGSEGQGADHELVGARMTEDRMRALNYPVARINRVRHLVASHMFPAYSSPKGARKFLQRVGDEHADDLLNLREADQSGKGQSPEEMSARTSVNTQRQLVDEARKQQAPTDLSNLAVNGNDLISLGMQPGPAIGGVLRQLLDHVVQSPSDNNRDRLLQLAEGYRQAQPEV